MLLGVVLVLAALGGIVYGVRKRQRAVTIGSAVALVLVVAVWVYFLLNPY